MPKLTTLFFFALLISASATSAAELGNFFFNGQAEEQSRKASAQALEGLTEIFSALRQRELENLAEGGKILASAVGALRDAARVMKGIQIPSDEDRAIQWERVAENDRRIVEAMARRLDRQLPKVPSELYKTFADSTDRLATLVEKQITNDNEPVLPALATEVALYIEFGNSVSNIGRVLN